MNHFLLYNTLHALIGRLVGRYLPGLQAKIGLGQLLLGFITLFLHLGFILARRSEWAGCTWTAFRDVLHSQQVPESIDALYFDGH
jgi:hypothetical protein